MARRRFAATRAQAVTISKFAIAFGALIAAAALAGCATSPVPATIEEQMWFDKAVGYDINKVQPQLRFEGVIGYPRTVR